MIIACGIDISKSWFDFSALEKDGLKDERFTNDTKGFRTLAKRLGSSVLRVHVCMEATGGYERALFDFLTGLGVTVSIVEPCSVRRVSDALGRMHKTDRLDARFLARYCEVFQPAPTPVQKPAYRELSLLVSAWKSLQLQRMELEDHLRSPLLPNAAQKAFRSVLRSVSKSMLKIEEAMDATVLCNEELAEDCRLLQSIKGIAYSSALQILANLPAGYRSHSARGLAAYCGLVPKQNESGSSVRRRTHVGNRCNRRMRTVLFMPALVARRVCPHLRPFADRLIARGKAKKQAIVAVMRKLSHAIWAVLVFRQPYNGAKLCRGT